MSWNEAIHLYAGPTCWTMPAAADLVVQPPAAAGDMLRRRHDTPCTLVLIDGFFDQIRSPWHKELLLLRARGFRLIGAASMGALRAAELDTLGMLGVGNVYRAFRAGRLTGDDEVAVSHAPAELGYRPLTKAMVDIRAQLIEEVRSRRMAHGLARCLLDDARAVPFRDRDRACLARIAVRHAVRPDLLDPDTPGLKMRDAIAAINVARSLRHIPPAAALPPPVTRYLQTLMANETEAIAI